MVQVRKASNEDLEKIVEFLSKPVIDNMFLKPLSERDISIRERVQKKYEQGIWLLLEENIDVIGCRAIIYDKNKETATLSTFAVHPNHKGKGYGSILYEKSLEVAKEYSPKKIIVDSWTGNKAAEYLAYKFGFTKVDEYDDPEKRPEGVKTVVYQKDL